MQIQALHDRFKSCKGVSTDSRHVRESDLFFALRGPNFNGNLYAEEALQNGASYAVVDDENLATKDGMICVDHVLETLQSLAAFHRRQFDIPVVAITGSNGKTTTKELTQMILSTTYQTVATKGNLNNHIGVPLTLLAIDSGTEVAIVEMGANHVGEIASYCPWADPTHGLITNIGKAHLEGFGGLEGVLKGKTELYEYLRSNGGTAIVSSRYPDLLERSRGLNRITYGETPESNCQAKFTGAAPFVTLNLIQNHNAVPVRSNLIGGYNFENILAAACIGKALGIDTGSIIQATERYIPKNNRSEFFRSGSNAILLDAYNANPSSMKEAIQNLDEIPADNKVAILGEMLELGAYSPKEHEDIVQMLKKSSIERVILVGKEFASVCDQIDCRYFENVAQLKQWLDEHPMENSYILIKGSRGVSLEKAVKRDQVSN